MTSGALSRERLRRADDVLTGYVERGQVPGLVYLVSRRGQTHVTVLGSMAAGGSDPMRRGSIFRISSMTKPVVAAAAMILVEECRLRLDVPVDDLLPELANRLVLRRIDSPLDDTVPANRPITVRDLLTFTQGIGIVAAMPGTYPIQSAMSELELGQTAPGLETPPAPDEWLRRLGSLPLIYQPGERWMYGTGSDILGVLIARASGMPLETFLRERIFEPLGMRDSGFHVRASEHHRLVTAYWTDAETGELTLSDDPATGAWSTPPAFPSGAGGMVSTIDDFHAFARMLLAGGKLGDERILSRPSVELMTQNHLTPEIAAASNTEVFLGTHGWGFGLSVVTRQTTIGEPVGAYGWDGGLGSLWRNSPGEELITVLLSQAAWTSPDPPVIASDALTLAAQAIDD